MIRIEAISKKFLLPQVKRETLREHVFGFWKRSEMEEFYALQNVSFEVEKGEFFGIVGRNGSGKSTLLKVLAGVYDADGGEVDMRGNISPFLELGVGFHPELTGRENVYLNGMLLGLSRSEVDDLFTEIFDFAGLDRFKDVQLKHYSSGMHARLAFSVAIQVEVDIYLMDEVLAVGDQEFQEKCYGVFRDFKARGKTVVLVTHGLGAVKEFCDRAMLLESGEVKALGNVDEVLGAYSS
jgi:ABC-type polysaccharide/polyol phosphate transport system ATPase subunit